MLHKDIAELNALTAPNLTYGHSSGKIQDKKAFIADIETGNSAFKPWRCKTRPSPCQATPRWCAITSPPSIEGNEVIPTEIENFQIWQKQDGKGLVGSAGFQVLIDVNMA